MNYNYYKPEQIIDIAQNGIMFPGNIEELNYRIEFARKSGGKRRSSGRKRKPMSAATKKKISLALGGTGALGALAGAAYGAKKLNDRRKLKEEFDDIRGGLRWVKNEVKKGDQMKAYQQQQEMKSEFDTIKGNVSTALSQGRIAANEALPAKERWNARNVARKATERATGKSTTKVNVTPIRPRKSSRFQLGTGAGVVPYKSPNNKVR